MKKISQIKGYCLPIKKVCFHPYKIFSHIKNDLVRYTKNPWQIATPNSHGKFLFQIPMEYSQGKFSRQTYTTNSQICNPEDGRISPMSVKREQITKQN